LYDYPENSAISERWDTTDVEGFALSAAAYVLAGDQLRIEQPAVYELYRTAVFDGRTYYEVSNGDGTTHIEFLN
jgi:hypothetical protein